MKLTLHLVDPEETIVTAFDSRDRRAFEVGGYRAMGLKGPLQAAVQAMPDTYVAWLAWHSLRRQELTSATFDEFNARLVDLDPEGEQEVLPDPTNPATSDV